MGEFEINNLEAEILRIEPSFIIYMYGGYGTGVFDEYSDMDLVIYCDSLPDEVIRESIRGVGSLILCENEKLDVIVYGGKKVDLRYMDESELSLIVEEKSLDFLNYVIYTRPVSRINSVISECQDSFDPRPFIYSSEQIEQKLGVLEMDLEKLKVAYIREDDFYLQYLKNYMVERILKVVYSLNEVPYVYPKKSSKMLVGMDLPINVSEIRDDLLYLVKKPDDNEFFYSKISKLEKIIGGLRKK